MKPSIGIIESLKASTGVLPYTSYSDADIQSIIQHGIELKPIDIFIKETKWKYLVRSALRARNILMLGDSGAGKTVTAYALAKVLHRPFEKFNIGAIQDARASLIGNTHVNSDGTIFDESLFIKMIQTPGAYHSP